MPNIVKPTGINTLWASGGTKVDPGAAKSNLGWVVELPPYQYQNWLTNKQDTILAHFNQHGIPEWDGETEYQGNLSYTQGSNGLIYKCLQTNTNKNPTNPVNSQYWTIAFENNGEAAKVQANLNTHLTNYVSLSGVTNAPLARANLSVWSRAESDTKFAATLGSVNNVFSVAKATNNNHAVPLGQLNDLLSKAGESGAGVLELATLGEVEQGVNDTKAITPLKATGVFVKKSQNLADVPNKAQARTNLGITSIATMQPSAFMAAANNLSELTNKALARSNLGLGSMALEAAGSYLRSGNNLSDVPNKQAARNNLGLTTMAVQDPNAYMTKADSLTGIGNPAHARLQLQLGSAATMQGEFFNWRSNNLADIPDKQAARNNLGLGPTATMPLYTPFPVAALDFTASLGVSGFQRIPGGFHFMWGRHNMGGGHWQQNVYFPVRFPNVCVNVQLTNIENAVEAPNVARVMTADANGFVLQQQAGNTYTEWFWFAIGW